MEQNYQNHARLVKGYHGVLFILLLAGLIGSIVNLGYSFNTDNLYSASLVVLLFIIGFIITAFVRLFPLKAQDRAIRAEENLRHFVITGKILPANLSVAQIIALRFAPDEEFISLAEKASHENLSAKQIKSNIKNWKADHYRV